MSYRKILVPIDFSDCAYNALDYAISFAQANESKMILLHAYHIPIPAAETGMVIDVNLADDFEKEAQGKIQKLYQAYSALESLVETSVIKLAFASDAILSEMKEHKVDLVIMGTHGATNTFDELVGSNTLHVIKRSEKPVLAVPANYKHFEIHEVLFAFDYQPIDREMLQPLIDFAFSFGAKIHILHITDKLERLHQGAIGEAKLMEQYLKGISHHYHMMEAEHVERGIFDYIKSHNIHVLVVMPRKHNLFQRWFQSSVTRQLVHHCNIPLLAFPER